MRTIIRQNSIFLGLCLIYIIILGVVLLMVPKGDLHLWLNPQHTAWADAFFRGYTVIAEWVPYVIVVLLLCYKAGWSAFLLADLLIAGLVGQGLKYLLDTPRPVTWFAENCPDVQLQLVDGVTMSRFYSFPSGHTITFFVLFFTLCLIMTEYYSRDAMHSVSPNAHTKPQITNSLLQILCFLLFLTGAYSRIYLSQHFAEDIWGGTVVGLLVSMSFLPLLPRFSAQKWWKYHFFAKKIQKNLVD